MHNRLNDLYCNCNAHTHINLAAGDDDLKKVKTAFETATKYLHDKGSFSSKDLKHKDVKPLIKETYKVLQKAVDTGLTYEVPTEMLNKLKTDVFVFSGMKTYAQLKEASLLLLDENNNKKQFYKYAQDISKINSNYNENHLRAEVNYAFAASESAAQWKEFEKDGDRYNLQFRTASDDKVRQSHALLQNITLPITDPFWNKYYTPLDWGCRCRIIQVLKSKYTVSDSADSVALGEKATPEIFRYNPGKQAVIFPPKHPYYKLSGEAKSILTNEAKTIFTAKEDDKKTDGKTINLADFIKNDSVSNNDVHKILQEYANIFPDDFRKGLEQIKFQKSSRFMMRHSMFIDSNKKWNSKSTITISTHSFGTFNPAKELKDGFLNVKNKQPLTFKQEYAFESLWHEILHAKTLSPYNKKTSLQTENMETVNQFVARHTYHDFLKAFGGEAVNQKEILEKGYGYKTWVANFRKKLTDNGIDEKSAVEFLKPHLLKEYSNLGEKIKQLFSKD